MNGTMRIINVDGSESTVTYTGRVPTLQELQAQIGNIEKVPYWDATKDGKYCVAYVGSGAKGAEGGAVEPENVAATDEWAEIAKKLGCMRPDVNIRDYDYLAGRVIVLSGDAAWMDEL